MAPRARRSAPRASWAGKTTVMMRNLPASTTQRDLLVDVARAGFGALFDFFYLPMNFKKQQSAGYAFINFLDPAAAAAFRRHYDGLRLGSDPVQVVPATTQGYEANLA